MSAGSGYDAEAGAPKRSRVVTPATAHIFASPEAERMSRYLDVEVGTADGVNDLAGDSLDGFVMSYRSDPDNPVRPDDPKCRRQDLPAAILDKAKGANPPD
jgi:hypothetical protein